MMKKNFAVIFDMDGVIVNNYKLHEKAWFKFIENHQLDFKGDFKKKIFGGSNKDHLTALFGREIEGEELMIFEEEKERCYREIYKPFVKPVDGLIFCIEDLKKNNVKLGLATSAPKPNVEFVLDNLNLNDCFQTVQDASCVINGKPDPEIFLKSAKSLNVKPGNILC